MTSFVVGVLTLILPSRSTLPALLGFPRSLSFHSNPPLDTALAPHQSKIIPAPIVVVVAAFLLAVAIIIDFQLFPLPCAQIMPNIKSLGACEVSGQS